MASTDLGSTIGRRSRSRLRLGVPAVMLTLDGNSTIRLDNLSETGAHITCSRDCQFKKGILTWLDYEVLCQVIWKRGLSCGLSFDEPISDAWVLSTRTQSAALLQTEKHSARSAAREWASGV